MSMMRPAAALMVSLLLSSAVLAQEAPDTILVNGKIVTVDDYFSIQEAVAISGQRIAAVGPNGEIRALAGSRTDVVDLGGRTVIPGLNDNHLHIIRATEYWPNEARLDGVNSRVAALAILEDKVATLADGEWLMSLGLERVTISYDLNRDQVQELLLGGPTVGSATLLRFYVLHVAVLPVALVALVTAHLWRWRKDSMMDPGAEDADDD